jgi:hypothetical protein
MAVDRVRPVDALKTYRYLRLGMIGAVGVLAASIGIESIKAHCLQNSISAYYYTPARAIFVGSMFVVGLSLIVYKGRTWWEDLFLNLAGMLAPVVALAPTIDIGGCYSFAPNPLPLEKDGSLAKWVVTNINNNIWALWIAGVIALVVAFIIWLINRSDSSRAAEIDPGTTWILGLTLGALVLAVPLILFWDDFDIRAHGYAADLFFFFLFCAIVANVIQHREERNTRWKVAYTAVAVLMGSGALATLVVDPFGRYEIFALEAWEIALFATYWIAQTVENWDEEVIEPVA